MLTHKKVPFLYYPHILLSACKSLVPHIMLSVPLLSLQRLLPLLPLLAHYQYRSEQNLTQVTFLKICHQFLHVLKRRTYARFLTLDLDQLNESLFRILSVQTVHSLLEWLVLWFVERVDLLVGLHVLLLYLWL